MRSDGTPYVGPDQRRVGEQGPKTNRRVVSRVRNISAAESQVVVVVGRDRTSERWESKKGVRYPLRQEVSRHFLFCRVVSVEYSILTDSPRGE